MVIHFTPALTCAQYVKRRDDQCFSSCGGEAKDGLITPSEGEAWELLPLCREHLTEFAELAADRMIMIRASGAVVDLPGPRFFAQ